MSLEAKIEALTAAVEKNNALLEKANAGRDAAIAAAEKLQTGAATSAKTTKTTKAAEPAAAPAESFAGDEGFQKLRGIAAEFLAVKEEAVLASRKAMFAKALGVATAGAGKLPDVAEADRGKMADILRTLMAGGEVEGVSPPKAEDDDMLG